MEENAKEYVRKIDVFREEIDKSFMRKLMKKCYLCAANCCDDSRSSEDVQRCVNNCEKPLMDAQIYVKNEFQDFQNRIERCFMVCDDTIKAKMEKEKAKFSERYKADYETCAAGCFTTHTGQLPILTEKIESNLQKFMSSS